METHTKLSPASTRQPDTLQNITLSMQNLPQIQLPKSHNIIIYQNTQTALDDKMCAQKYNQCEKQESTDEKHAKLLKKRKNQAYYERNQSKILQQREKNYFEKKDSILQKRRKYYDEKKDSILQYKKEYYHKNTVKFQQYYNKNIDSKLKYKQKYVSNNLAKARACQANWYQKHNTDNNLYIPGQYTRKRQCRQPRQSLVADSSNSLFSQVTTRTAVDDPKPTVRDIRVQEPAQVNSDPQLFCFGGACPIEKNAFIMMMRALGIRVVQINRPKATLVHCETELKTFRYLKNDIIEGQTVITYGEFFARNIKIPLIPQVKFVLGVGKSENEIFLYRKKMDLLEQGTGKWYRHSGSDTDAFQAVYIEKQFLFAWQYAIDAKRESRDINNSRRRILYSVMAIIMAKLAVSKALGKQDRCLLIHCFDKENTRQFYPKESDYAATVPFTKQNKILPSKFKLQGQFMLEYAELSTLQKMLMLFEVCDDLKSELYTYNILDKLPAGHKEKALQFKNIPITERNNTVFNFASLSKKKYQPCKNRFLPLEDRTWGGKPLANQVKKPLQKVQSDDEETDEEQIKKKNAIAEEQLQDQENYTLWIKAKMPGKENGGEEFRQYAALKEINQKHLKHKHRKDNKLIGKRPFQKRKPAQQHSCDYHDKLIQTKENSRLEASIGNKETDKLTRGWLFEILNAQKWNDRKTGTMIELMAGYGRNLDSTKHFFKNIEMLDGSSEMTKCMSRKVIRHQCKLEEFEWPKYEKYDCILGVFCLGYLEDLQILQIFSAAKHSLKKKGKLIMLEPVAYKKQLHQEKGQQLWIRNKKDYEQLLFNTGYQLVNDKLYIKEQDLSHNLHSLVWIKS